MHGTTPQGLRGIIQSGCMQTSEECPQMAALLVVQFQCVAGSIDQSGGGCATGTGCQRQGRQAGGALGTAVFQFAEPAAQ